MKLAFSLESWEACGGDGELTGDEALREGNGHIDTALQIFKEASYCICMINKSHLVKFILTPK